MAFNPLRGAAQGIAGRALKRVAGNIKGGLLGVAGKGSNLSDFASLSQTKYSTKNYSFPLDVEGPPGTGNQGHYIIFYVNQQTNSKLTFGESEVSEGKKNLQKAARQHKIKSKPSGIDGPADAAAAQKAKQQNLMVGGLDDSNVAGQKQREQDAKPASAKKISTTMVQRPATVRMDTAITLYMPPSVQVSYNANYTDTDIGAGAAIAANAYQDIIGKKSLSDVLTKAGSAVGAEMGDAAIRTLLGAADMIPGLEGAMEAVEMQRGFIKTPRMELAFKGIPKRSFQYDFKMIPKSAAEAEEIQKIIKGFKLNMLPEMKSGTANRLTMPNTFDISYMYNGAENQYLHKISTCVLETMAVTYGGDRYKTFEATGNGAPPVEVGITLGFKEMDLITRELANQGF